MPFYVFYNQSMIDEHRYMAKVLRDEVDLLENDAKSTNINARILLWKEIAKEYNGIVHAHGLASRLRCAMKNNKVVPVRG